MENKYVISGLVRKIEQINHSLSFATIVPVTNEEWEETRTPVYMKVGKEYEGKVVEVVTERTGFLGRNFKQTISRSDSGIKSIVEMSYSMVEQINAHYRSRLLTDLVSQSSSS